MFEKNRHHAQEDTSRPASWTKKTFISLLLALLGSILFWIVVIWQPWKSSIMNLQPPSSALSQRYTKVDSWQMTQIPPYTASTIFAKNTDPKPVLQLPLRLEQGLLMVPFTLTHNKNQQNQPFWAALDTGSSMVTLISPACEMIPQTKLQDAISEHVSCCEEVDCQHVGTYEGTYCLQSNQHADACAGFEASYLSLYINYLLSYDQLSPPTTTTTTTPNSPGSSLVRSLVGVIYRSDGTVGNILGINQNSTSFWEQNPDIPRFLTLDLRVQSAMFMTIGAPPPPPPTPLTSKSTTAATTATTPRAAAVAESSSNQAILLVQSKNMFITVAPQVQLGTVVLRNVAIIFDTGTSVSVLATPDLYASLLQGVQVTTSTMASQPVVTGGGVYAPRTSETSRAEFVCHFPSPERAQTLPTQLSWPLLSLTWSSDEGLAQLGLGSNVLLLGAMAMVNHRLCFDLDHFILYIDS